MLFCAENDILAIDDLNDLMDDPDEIKNVIPSAGVRILLKRKLREHVCLLIVL